MSHTETTHASLLDRIRDRADEGSWRDFHARYGHLLYRYARARGAGHADAEDVAQEVLAQFVRASAGFEYDPGKGRFRGYLRTSVVREMSRRARRAARRPAEMDPRHFDFVEAAREAGRDDGWEQEWRLGELRWAVHEIAAEFDATTLKAFEMYVLAGRPVSETAAQLGISNWRVYRARKRVLRRLTEGLDASGFRADS